MLKVSPKNCGFKLELDSIAPDKSISHRSVIFSLLSNKPSVIGNYLQGEDTLNTLKIAQELGLQVEKLDSSHLRFIPPKSIKEPLDVLDCGNAGTAMRLYTGLLAASKGFFVLSGDKYLNQRPMNRVITPLREIGAEIFSREGGFAPIGIIGKKLKGFKFQSQISSAQVKSAMILAALQASEPSVYVEQELSRDHTERMLIGMGADLKIIESSTLDSSTPEILESKILESKSSSTQSIVIKPLSKPLESICLEIPADPSSAFFFALVAAITPKSEVILKNVLLNKTRIEAFEVLKKMGAKVEFNKLDSTYEDVGDIYVAHNELHGVIIEENISWLIDEIPALSIAMALANGTSEVRNAKELRVKESDRIKAVIQNLRVLGIECEEKEDGFRIFGAEFKGGEIESFGDHRIAMSFAIAGLVAPVSIQDYECINISFPNFLEILARITRVDLE